MSKFKVFIDGESGTTGLQIRQRLEHHSGIQVVSIDHEKRRDLNEKAKILDDVDVTILCLPDDAAKEAAKHAEALNDHVRILDASSAHRTAEGWVYGMAEMSRGQRAEIHSARKVSNPGCYATGAILLYKPLTDAGIIKPDHLVAINAVSGYSGGGKNLIRAYEEEGGNEVPAVGLYGLNFAHKHTLEIEKWAGLDRRPLFIPSVANFHQGMLVHSQFDFKQLNKKISSTEFLKVYQEYYKNEAVVRVHELNSIEEGYAPYLSPHNIEGKNQLDIFVYASDEWEEGMIVAKLDNLGKGASGAAVQNLNVMLGLPEDEAVHI